MTCYRKVVTREQPVIKTTVTLLRHLSLVFAVFVALLQILALRNKGLCAN